MTRTISVDHNGTTYAGEVMRIKSTMLGTEDHGIVTAYLHCEVNGSSVGVGGYSLDTPVESDRSFAREGTAYGLDHLLRIMETVGVSRWEALPGKDVIVLSEGSGGWGSMAVGIANLLDSKVLIFSEHLAEWKANHPEQVGS